MAKTNLATQPSPTLTQDKYLAANNTTATPGTVLIQFNNLTVGKWYRCSGICQMQLNAADDSIDVLFNNGATTVNRVSNDTNTSAGGEGYYNNYTFVFQATATTIAMVCNSSLNSNTFISGSGGRFSTYMTLEEYIVGSYASTTNFT